MRPRIRTLKPEIWEDERVGDLSHGARLLFIGLITMADDEGRLRELPPTILGHVFPYDDVSASKLSRWLREVAATGMVVRYVSEGKRYIAFRRWGRHQRVDKPNPSDLPDPPDFDDDSSNGSENGSENDSSSDRGSFSDQIEDRSRSLRVGAAPIRSDPDPSSLDKADDARALFEYWQERCGHPSSRPTKERVAKIRSRLSEGYSSADVRKAIDGAARAAFVNDQGKRFDDIELICRNGSKLESFMARATALRAVALERSPVLQRMDRWRDALEYRRGESA